MIYFHNLLHFDWFSKSTIIISNGLINVFGLITIVCFLQWLGFICKVNLRRKQDEKTTGLMCTFFWVRMNFYLFYISKDLILYAFIALYFILNLKSTIGNGETQAHDVSFRALLTILQLVFILIYSQTRSWRSQKSMRQVFCVLNFT